ncbi:hypothetical protein B0H13DRAFT_2074011 [Mycena leptocephala]|nr:hypothetical protein B0H13DRAFT_2074011 [Mycena leptocephala]
MPGVDLLFGPLIEALHASYWVNLGVMLNMILYGMFTYYQRYTNDSAWIQCLMLYLFVVETANVVVEFGIIYQPLIVEFGTKAATTISPRHSILISIVAAPIQLFTAWRMSVITALLSLGSFGSGIAVSFFVFTNPEFRNFERFTTVIIVWLVLSATCDIVIAIGMTFALDGYVRIDGQINRIIRLTVETGALTAITALVDVGLFLIFPSLISFRNFIPDLALSGLYTCSILAMLNSRDRSKTADAEHAHVQTPPNTMLSQSTLKPQPSFRSKKVFEIYTTTVTSSDTLSEKTPVAHLRSDVPRTRTDGSKTPSERAIPSYRQPVVQPYDGRGRDVPRPRTDSDSSTSQRSVPLPSHSQPDFYNYNGHQRARSRSRDAPPQRSLPSTPRPTLPTQPRPQRPPVPNRPMPEKF